jgi:hypothetical protein
MRTEERIVTWTCDRCGKKVWKVSKIGIFRTKRIILAFLVFLYNPVEEGVNLKEYDLCEDCRKSLTNWLNDKGKKP